MDGVALFGLLIIFGIVAGAVLGIVSYFEVRKLRAEVRRLRSELVAQPATPASPRSDEVPLPPLDLTDAEDKASAPAAVSAPSPSAKKPAPENAKPSAAHLPEGQVWPTESGTSSPVLAGFWSRLQQHWMVWLGGGCVALAGIFLARYGIEQGLLGPKTRVAMGLLTALALYLSAEYLRRKTGEPHPVFAALAGGGAITAFAAVLSAVHLYQLISPGFAFGLLAVVALITLWLARLHGPVLAAIGMLGAYSVPILVSSGQGNVLAAMAYALIITVSVLLLLRHVYRAWLWLGWLAGALLWWLISLTGDQADGWRGPYLAILGYLALTVVPGDWLLRGRSAATKHIEPLILPSLLVLVAAQCLSILREGLLSSAEGSLLAEGSIPAEGSLLADGSLLAEGSLLGGSFSSLALLTWTPLALVVLIGARQRAGLAIAAWALWLGQCVAWGISRLDPVSGEYRLSPFAASEQGPFLLWLGVTAVVFAVLSLHNFRRGVARYWWASLAVMAPVLALLTGYLLAGDYLSLYWWCLYAAIMGAVFVYLGSRGAGKGWPKSMVLWLFAAGHFGYSLAVCLWLQQASLTLALALQAVSLAWLIRRFDVPALGWLLKGVLLLVVMRLTLNPWLLSYPEGSHWSLWTYGGAAVCAWLAARMLVPGFVPLARWAEAAALHLFVLALWAETRYWLYGGNTFAAEYTFTEAVVNMWLFAGLGLVYYRKSLVSDQFTAWYDGYGRLLMLAAVINYLWILLATATSEPWAWESVSGRPLFNLLLPAFAGPALLAWLASRYYLPQVRKWAAGVAAAAAFIWISLEVRHLWQGNIRLDTPAETGELYTYSAVWLLMAVGSILIGSWRGWRSCYQAGMAVLALVIVKLFLVDMSGLEGLLRVASFMGMGLALLGIAYLHQKLAGRAR
ncbi:DUF2339 domain-containing protein [Microbulbifer sp.]|uniref:DUF2339 domain-containing protein n=1 Tax=Microbulbifer sp. TaxID=1908541 RepID=UPI00258A1B52|nr:DUF2339 domain-containing protein [Microbulbifer sp.]